MSQILATSAITLLLLCAAVTALGLWIHYLIIKAAVRDGMLEAQRQQRPPPQRPLPLTASDDPHVRATR